MLDSTSIRLTLAIPVLLVVVALWFYITEKARKSHRLYIWQWLLLNCVQVGGIGALIMFIFGLFAPDHGGITFSGMLFVCAMMGLGFALIALVPSVVLIVVVVAVVSVLMWLSKRATRKEQWVRAHALKMIATHWTDSLKDTPREIRWLVRD